MITILLEKIITILEGWLQSFTSHAQHVEDKLDSLDQTASDIKTNTEPISDIKDNTGAVITPIQNIKTNTDSIATSSQTSANNTTAILNNVSTLSTNTGRAAAFAEDCANNTLEIKDKITTIASDTTQIRADHVTLENDLDKIYNAIKWSCLDIETTETESGASPLSFNTDKAAALVSLISNIIGSQSGSGTPSPDNEKPITWLDESNITVNGNTFTSTFNNHVYEGYIDIVSGKLIITKQGLKFTGDVAESWVDYAVQNGFYINTPNNVNATITSALCNIFEIVSSYSNFGIRIAASGDRLYFCHMTDNITGVTDLASWKTWLSTHNVYFVGTLNIPLEVSLTPETINALIGDNIVSSDTNGNIEVTYKESVKHYLDKHNQ